MYDSTGDASRQCGLNTRNQRLDIIQSIRLRVKYYEKERILADILLEEQALINRYECIEVGAHSLQELANGDAGPPHFGDRFDFVAGKQRGQATGQTFIEENARGQPKQVRLLNARHQSIPGRLEKLYDAMASDSWKISEETVQRIAALDVIEEGLYGNTRPPKDGSSIQNLGIRFNHVHAHILASPRIECRLESINWVSDSLKSSFTCASSRSGSSPFRGA